MAVNSRLVIAVAGAASVVLGALVADRHAQNHYTPSNRRKR
ncbi:MAG TPA: hypothetical protein VH134_18350 [Candidatus Dormibacteraeota bacterium]|nr:hypothetical protein [Candidatus Dormibacteraeota bacterium]